MPQRATSQTERLLTVMLDDPARQWHGFELMTLTKLSSGTVYPLLHRLQADGWLTSEREDVDPHNAGRPRRRLYRLTASGEVGAREMLDRRLTRRGERAPAIAAPRRSVLT